MTATNYRIYEEIDIRTTVVDDKDIVVDETDTNKLKKKGIPETEYYFYKKRILSILEIKKMFPVVKEVYHYADLDTDDVSIEEKQRRILMNKEYFFCKSLRAQIEKKAKKIYEKQISSQTVMPYYCNFKRLEGVADTYK